MDLAEMINSKTVDPRRAEDQTGKGKGAEKGTPKGLVKVKEKAKATPKGGVPGDYLATRKKYCCRTNRKEVRVSDMSACLLLNLDRVPGSVQFCFTSIVIAGEITMILPDICNRLCCDEK